VGDGREGARVERRGGGLLGVGDELVGDAGGVDPAVRVADTASATAVAVLPLGFALLDADTHAPSIKSSKQQAVRRVRRALCFAVWASGIDV
jgi:hypothetical protein